MALHVARLAAAWESNVQLLLLSGQPSKLSLSGCQASAQSSATPSTCEYYYVGMTCMRANGNRGDDRPPVIEFDGCCRR